MSGKLYLIPITLGESSIESVIPTEVIESTIKTRHFIVENIRTTRRYLRLLDKGFPIDDTQFYELNKRTTPEQISGYLKPLEEGFNVGVVSEAGVPGVADPGAAVVELAHQNNIQVIPFVGPSSILMSVMASGLNGQNFAFNGYLPIKSGERVKHLKHLEKRSIQERQSQLFIETPYRNGAMIDDILNHCLNSTKLCIACDITLENEFIKTDTVQNWKKNKPNINKRPAIFIIQG
ncbi:MAG: SAM-dependent methyltransferase [Salinivirgaceae bacterium]|jgi:16S rRNA (cytidine1402-2'-O)-methyltransferase|nr:SAM-dependent methyltransferase [Salinivirgaceae bacterium]